MSEKNLWHKLRTGLAPYLRLQRIEDRYSRGVPDVLYAGRIGDNLCFRTLGLVELKFLKAWPKRATTTAALRTFRPEQRAWLKLFGEASNGAVYVLLQVGRTDLLLFHWKVLGTLGCMTQAGTRRLAQWSWQGRMTSAAYESLAMELTQTY